MSQTECQSFIGYITFSHAASRCREYTHISRPRLPLTLKPHQTLPLRPFDPVRYIDPTLHLIQLAPNPRNLTGEINLVAEHLPHLRIRPERIHRRSDNGGALLLVVEYAKRRNHHDNNKNGKMAKPAGKGGDGRQSPVGTALHQGTRARLRGGDDGSSKCTMLSEDPDKALGM